MATPKNDIKLGYDKTNMRFKKMVKGTMWRSSRGLLPTDKSKAVKEFLGWLAQQEEPEYPPVPETWQEYIQDPFPGSPNYGDPIKNPPHLIPGNPIKLAYEAGLAAVATKGKTIGDAVSDFLSFKKSRVGKGQLVCQSAHLKILCHHCGNLPIDGVTISHWTSLMDDVSSEKRSADYGHNITVTIRAFFNWLFETERLEVIPRFVMSKLFMVKIPQKLPEFFSTAELALLFGAASPLQKLHWLLCLNCGMTQMDLSDLKWSMLDLKKGTLTRQRGKHQSQTSDRIPTVVYTLWPEVKAGLSKLPQTGDRVFLNSNGKPLVRDNRNDAVAAHFKLVAKSVGITKTFKVFRKTGCTLIGTAYRGWRDLYLANTSKEVVDKNYDGTTTLPAEVTDHIRSQLPKVALA